jgi:hypothetical protein
MERNNYGFISVGTDPNNRQEIKIESVMQFEFADTRLITVGKLIEDNGYFVTVENREDTGRETAKLWVSEVSFKALVAALELFTIGAEMSPGECFEQLVDADKFDYRISDNLKDPFDVLEKRNQEEEVANAPKAETDEFDALRG